MRIYAIFLVCFAFVFSGSVKADELDQVDMESQLQEMMSFEVENISRTETTVRSCEIRSTRTSLRRCVVFGQVGQTITKIDLRKVYDIAESEIFGDLILRFRPAELPMDQSLLTEFSGSTQAWYCDGSFAGESENPLPSLIFPYFGHNSLPSMLSEYDQTYCK